MSIDEAQLGDDDDSANVNTGRENIHLVKTMAGTQDMLGVRNRNDTCVKADVREFQRGTGMAAHFLSSYWKFCAAHKKSGALLLIASRQLSHIVFSIRAWAAAATMARPAMPWPGVRATRMMKMGGRRVLQ